MSATDQDASARKGGPWGALSVIALVVIFLAFYVHSFRDHGETQGTDAQVASDAQKSTPVAVQPAAQTGAQSTVQSSSAPAAISATPAENLKPASAASTPAIPMPAMPTPAMPSSAMPMSMMPVPPMRSPAVPAPAASAGSAPVEPSQSPAAATTAADAGTRTTEDANASVSSSGLTAGDGKAAALPTSSAPTQTSREQAMQQVEARAFANALLGTEDGTVESEIWLAEPFMGEKPAPKGVAPIPVQAPAPSGYLLPAPMDPLMRQRAWMDSAQRQWRPSQPYPAPGSPMAPPPYPVYSPYR